MRSYIVHVLIAVISLLIVEPVFAADVAGGTDHPLIRRFEGSSLVGYHHSGWAQLTFPTSAEVVDSKMKAPETVEGVVTQMVYLSPRGKSPLEVYRNYEQALMVAGFEKQFSCESNCSDLYFAWSKTLDVVNGFQWLEGGNIPTPSGSTYSLYSAPSNDEGRMLYGTIMAQSKKVHVLVYSSFAAFPVTEIASTVIEVVEPKDMPTGQVLVDPNAMQKQLQDEGKIALYGIYFDTGKAVLKPESKPQLEAMAKLLNEQKIKVYIVGHTDNQGTMAGNLLLSQKRADAVVAALRDQYKVDAATMVSFGAFSLSPVASNTDEAGRAKNRRVELVVQ